MGEIVKQKTNGKLEVSKGFIAVSTFLIMIFGGLISWGISQGVQRQTVENNKKQIEVLQSVTKENQIEIKRNREDYLKNLSQINDRLGAIEGYLKADK